MNSPTAGFTLLELLVAMAVATVISLAAFQLMTSSQQVTDLTVNQSARIEDLQSVAALVADDVRQTHVISDSLDVPLWTGILGGVQSLTLTLKVPGCVVSQVAYVTVPRANLTGVGVSEWLRVATDAANNTQRALIRATRCDLVINRRLVGDYLEVADFRIGMMGTSAFSATPTAATGGTPYQAVEFDLVSRRSFRGKSQRLPSQGVMTFVSASKVIR